MQVSATSRVVIGHPAHPQLSNTKRGCTTSTARRLAPSALRCRHPFDGPSFLRIWRQRPYVGSHLHLCRQHSKNYRFRSTPRQCRISPELGQKNDARSQDQAKRDREQGTAQDQAGIIAEMLKDSSTWFLECLLHRFNDIVCLKLGVPSAWKRTKQSVISKKGDPKASGQLQAYRHCACHV